MTEQQTEKTGQPVFKDYFSKQATIYSKYRPDYPSELFEYLNTVVKGHDFAWDCGTGNGQAAVGLTPYFDHVIASDPSEAQLSNGFQHPKIEYRLATAEEPGIEPGTIDLVTAAQALHWFDRDRFFAAAREAMKPDGVIAVWAYTLCRTNPEIDRIVDDFYLNIVGPYWPKERNIVDDQYSTIEFPFQEWKAPYFEIVLEWDALDMINYLETWSPVRRYIEKHGTDPVDLVQEPILSAWGNPAEKKIVKCPVYMRIGKTG